MTDFEFTGKSVLEVDLIDGSPAFRLVIDDPDDVILIEYEGDEIVHHTVLNWVELGDDVLVVTPHGWFIL